MGESLVFLEGMALWFPYDETKRSFGGHVQLCSAADRHERVLAC